MFRAFGHVSRLKIMPRKRLDRPLEVKTRPIQAVGHVSRLKIRQFRLLDMYPGRVTYCNLIQARCCGSRGI